MQRIAVMVVNRELVKVSLDSLASFLDFTLSLVLQTQSLIFLISQTSSSLSFALPRVPPCSRQLVHIDIK